MALKLLSTIPGLLLVAWIVWQLRPKKGERPMTDSELDDRARW